MPHVRNSVYPDFLSSFPALTNFMRLFDESRTRIRWWRPVQEIRDHAPKKMGRSPSIAFSHRFEDPVQRGQALFLLR